MKNRKKIILIILIALIVVTGFLRDFLFVNINGQIFISHYNSEQIGVSTYLRCIWGKSVNELENIKWILTLGFTIIYFCYSAVIVFVIFKQLLYIYLTGYVFLSVIIISGITIFLGKLLPEYYQNTYEISRFLMGMVQSPVVLMILIPIFLLMRDAKK